MNIIVNEFRSALGWYRIARYLDKHDVPLLPSIVDYFIRLIFACWIPHSAKIGKNVVLGYGGLGIVIHSKAIIGDNVEIGQGVTIGGNARVHGEPTICDNVYIGCGAKLLGPITVGRGAIIGANSVVLENVPENSVVAGIPARILHKDIDTEHYLWHRKNRISI